MVYKKMAIATLACMSGMVNASITCFTFRASCDPNQQSTFFWLPTGKQLSDANGAVAFINFQGSNINDVVGSIMIGNPGPLVVQTPDVAVNVSNGGERATIGALYQITGSAASNMWISLIAIEGDLGFLGPNERRFEGLVVRNIGVGGDCYADILAFGTDVDTLGHASLVVDGDWVSGSYSNRTAPSVFEMVIGGFVGSINNPVEIWAANRISIITIGGDFIGQVGENDDGYVGHPDIGNVEIGGDFIGSGAMTMNSLDRFIIGGNFDADVTLSTAMSSSTDLYKIGGAFASTASITLPADGLVGQVLINSGDTSNLWDGNIAIGSTTLAGPDELDYTTYYTQLSSELGGGAVGHAPFNFHQRETAPPAGESMDCNPYQNEVRALALSEKLDFVEISHYGPVYADGTGPHFRVEFLPGMEVNPVWVDKTSMFEIDSDIAIPNPTGTSDGTASRVVTIKAVAGNKEAFKAAGKWRIRPIQGKVKCGSVVGNPNVRYTSSVVSGDLGTLGIFSWYQFDVLMELQPGIFALDSGNGTQASDLAAWMLTPFETNADGETNTQDFIDMANQYTGN